MSESITQTQPKPRLKAKLTAMARHFTGYAKKPKFLKKICTWTATRFLTKIHHLTHRVPVTLRELEQDRVLVVAPHMDDEMIGAGGALALHHELGSVLGLVFTADCAGVGPDPQKNDTEAKVRQAEAEVAAAYFDMDYHGTLGYPCGSLSLNETAMGKDLAKLIRKWNPNTIFCPFPSDHHRDHQATAMGLMHALKETGWQGEVWGYEIWSTIWPNTAVDITSVTKKKQESIECYPSQIKYMSYVESALGLNRYRGLRVLKESAEAYYVCSAKQFQKICGHLLEL
ncbi:MAG: LmbE family N-acetylglucosaminyl deacetylase [Verrucomicrobiales bacterium]|jgi:LmbE family N-acetylglucosaminyl deacetylase